MCHMCYCLFLDVSVVAVVFVFLFNHAFFLLVWANLFQIPGILVRFLIMPLPGFDSCSSCNILMCEFVLKCDDGKESPSTRFRFSKLVKKRSPQCYMYET